MGEEFDLEKKKEIEMALKLKETSAKSKLDKQKRYYEAKLSRMNENWTARLNESHQELRCKLNNQFENEMKLNAEKWRRECDAEMESLRVEFGKQVELNEARHRREMDEMIMMQLKLQTSLDENVKLRQTIAAVTAEFQKCIQRFSHMRKEEAEFLFPIS